MLHHPFLFGEILTQSKPRQRNFWRRFRGGIGLFYVPIVGAEGTPSSSTRFLITNLISLQLHYLPFASRFPLPHFTQFVILFALFFVCIFFSSDLLFAYLVVMASSSSIVCTPENKVLNFKKRGGENLKDAWYRISMLIIDLSISNLLLFFFAVFMWISPLGIDSS